MKSTKVILAVAGIFVAGVAAQVPANFPACGEICIRNMIAKAPELGCPNKEADPLCLCKNEQFNYGIRDCAFQACANDTAAGIVVQYGAAYCKSNKATDVSLAMTETATTTGTGGVTSAVAPAPTGVSVTTIVSGDSTIVSTIPTSGTDASSTPAASSSSFTSVITSNGTPVTSTGVATAPTSSSGASSSGGAASSTNGVVPRQTAAPAGLLAVAGVAVLFL